jgi:molecular chaperone DnaK
MATLEGLIKEGREAVEKQDDDKVKDVSERLEKEAHRLAGQMYGASAPPGAGGNGGPMPPTDGVPPGGAGKKDGGVIDAEFEETGG